MGRLVSVSRTRSCASLPRFLGSDPRLGIYGSPSGAEVPKLNSPHENQCRNLNNFNAIGTATHYPYKKS
jgi:hypothetical protein